MSGVPAAGDSDSTGPSGDSERHVGERPRQRAVRSRERREGRRRAFVVAAVGGSVRYFPDGLEVAVDEFEDDRPVRAASEHSRPLDSRPRFGVRFRRRRPRSTDGDITGIRLFDDPYPVGEGRTAPEQPSGRRVCLDRVQHPLEGVGVGDRHRPPVSPPTGEQPEQFDLVEPLSSRTATSREGIDRQTVAGDRSPAIADPRSRPTRSVIPVVLGQPFISVISVPPSSIDGASSPT